MTKTTYNKILTDNDTGETKSHQAGMHIPKGEKGFLSFLPKLDSQLKNPDCWLCCKDEENNKWMFRFVYYNNKLHNDKGTRDEFRITRMTKYFRSRNAKSNDIFSITKIQGNDFFRISVETRNEVSADNVGGNIKLTGWSKVC